MLALQSLVSRETDPLGSSVISVTQINGGAVFNVIPDAVELAGTVRALTDEWSGTLQGRIEEVRPLTADPAGASCTCTMLPACCALKPGCCTQREHKETRSPASTPQLANANDRMQEAKSNVDVFFAQVVKHQAATYGCTGEVDWRLDSNPYYPAAVNDKGAHEFAVDIAER